MSIDIRQATPDDAEEACKLLRRSIEEGCAADHGQRAEILQAWLSNKTLHNVRTWFSSPSNYAVVAVHGQEIAGMALLTQAGKLALCYVLPGQLRKGTGSAMVHAIETRARSWDIAKLHMHSPASASGFFERLGYVNAGKDKACFGLECDFLWKQLGAAEAPASKRFCGCGAQ
jgi:N-acetylglutamate synthase-like GNAT family acetyltransferase